MIQKRQDFINPMLTINIWLIPTFTYLLLKYVAQTTFRHEWVWWVIIPLMFTTWLIINFKFGKKPKKNFGRCLKTFKKKTKNKFAH